MSAKPLLTPALGSVVDKLLEGQPRTTAPVKGRLGPPRPLRRADKAGKRPEFRQKRR